MQIKELILGGPGAGKTTELLRLVKQDIKRGTAPERIAFVAFTKAAAQEARGRAATELGLSPKALHYWRTLHSMAFECLGLNRNEVMNKSHWDEIGAMLGVQFGSGWGALDGPAMGSDKEGDKLQYLMQLATSTQRPVEEVWEKYGAGLLKARVVQFVATINTYKQDLGLVYFSDMLSRFIAMGKPVDVDAVYLDEAQDLTAEQWQACRVAFSGAKKVTIAGDDDQAIYQWAGADMQQFLHLGVAPRVLPISHRLPAAVFSKAQDIAQQIPESERYSKDWKPSARQGAVHSIAEPENLDLQENKDTWLMLARNAMHLKRYVALCRLQGVPYVGGVNTQHVHVIQCYEAMRAGKPVEDEDRAKVAEAMDNTPLNRALLWHDALTAIDLDDREFYLTCLRRGESLTKEPRVRISTIHGAKGQEADRVCVVGDMTARTYAGYQDNPTAEHRVFYVAATRAKQALYLCHPLSRRSYSLV